MIKAWTIQSTQGAGGVKSVRFQADLLLTAICADA
jgi:hypothetical protein